MYDLVVSLLDKTNTVYQLKNGSIKYKCQICGDYKYRGGIKIEEDSAIAHCFNCEGSPGISFYGYLDETGYSNLAKEYLRGIQKNKIQNRGKSINTDLFKEESQENNQKDPKVEDDSIPLTKDGLPLIDFEMMVYTFSREEETDETVFDLVELTVDSIEYLQSRGLTEEDYEDFKYVEETKDIVVPFWSNKEKNQVYGIQTRGVYAKKFHNQFFKSWDAPSFKFYNLDYILSLPKGTDVYVFESIFDYLSTGIKNAGAIIGKSMSEEVKNLLKDYNLIYCMDCDKDGHISALEMAYDGNKVLVHDFEEMEELKDYNKLLELGCPKEDIEEYITSHIQYPRRAIAMLQKEGYKLPSKKKKY